MNLLKKIFGRHSMASLQDRAAAGDAEAQFQLAQQHIDALRVGNLDVSVEDAFDLIAKSAAQKYAPAVSYLQAMHHNQSVRQSPQHISDMLSAATNGDVNACLDLVYRYATGDGLEKSKEKEEYWYKKAAELGSSRAQLVVGLQYICEGDRERGLELLRKSAAQGNQDAIKQLDLSS